MGLAALATLSMLGAALCFLNMLVGVGGAIGSGFVSGQLAPLLNLPALGTVVSTNFDTLSGIIAVLYLAAFCNARLPCRRDRKSGA